MDRLGTAFSESFPLNLPAISTVLSLTEERQGRLNNEIMKQETYLGNNYIKAMPRYARGCGILHMGSYETTPWGKLLATRDTQLTNLATQWLMHYYLSSPAGPGPVFWSRLVRERLRIGDKLDRSQVAEEISQLVGQETGKFPASSTAGSVATAFLGTYARSDALGSLGILEKERNGVYRVTQPETPSPLTVAYALADYWERAWEGQPTVNLERLTEPGEFTSIFFMGTENFDKLLNILKKDDILDVYRTAPPYQIVRLWESKEQLMQNLYE